MFLIRSLVWYGGAQRQLANLTKGLARGGHDVIVVTYYPDPPLETELVGAGVEVRNLGKRGRWDLLGPIARFIRLVRMRRPVILHGYLSTANILALLAKACCPSIKVVWGLRASNMRWDRYDWLHQLSFACERWLSRFADLLIVNSFAGSEYLVTRGFQRAKLRVIHNGIDTDRFQPEKQAGSRCRVDWGIGADDRVVGLVGRLDPMKDHATFLRASALLARAHPRLRFVCIGEGPERYRSDLQALADELKLGDRLLWVGPCFDMVPAYNACDVIVSSSAWGEGFANVLGEAISCGVRCVATDVGDSARIVAGSGGRVVPPNDPSALAEAIRCVVEDESPASPAELHERARRLFSQEHMVQATEEQLARLLCH